MRTIYRIGDDNLFGHHAVLIGERVYHLTDNGGGNSLLLDFSVQRVQSDYKLSARTPEGHTLLDDDALASLGKSIADNLEFKSSSVNNCQVFANVFIARASTNAYQQKMTFKDITLLGRTLIVLGVCLSIVVQLVHDMRPEAAPLSIAVSSLIFVVYTLTQIVALSFRHDQERAEMKQRRAVEEKAIARTTRLRDRLLEVEIDTLQHSRREHQTEPNVDAYRRIGYLMAVDNDVDLAMRLQDRRGVARLLGGSVDDDAATADAEVD